MGWVNFEVRTKRRAELVDITERVAEAVARSGVVGALGWVGRGPVDRGPGETLAAGP